MIFQVRGITYFCEILTMKIIIPMAGMGKRMRPHTLTTPKPLLPIAGKPMVQWIAEDIAKVCTENIEEIAFVIGNFGKEVESTLLSIARSLGAKGRIYYQPEALGTAHAVLCAGNSLNGKVVIAFADTLFSANFKMDEGQDGIIWVQKIKDPSQFGVVKVNDQNTITDFIEKPKTFVSDLAIIGIYYFRDGENLRNELQHLIDHQIIKNGEYQLTDALQNMKNKGIRFSPGAVDEWLDCGNKDATVHTNQRILATREEAGHISPSAMIINSKINAPCFVGDNTVIENSSVGPYVAIGACSKIKDSVLQDCIVQTHAELYGCNIRNSMIGNNTEIHSLTGDLSIGDYCVIK